jgi:hypothetical protein
LRDLHDRGNTFNDRLDRLETTRQVMIRTLEEDRAAVDTVRETILL